jgi:starch-binding outer membrane protein, SusD/RagB family
MKQYSIKMLFMSLVTVALWSLSSCQLEQIDNPNAPDQLALENGGATLNDLRLLANGLEGVMRVDLEFHYWTLSVVGREYWDLRGTDPRYTGELLGAQGAPLDPNGFLTTRAYLGHYRAVRSAWSIIKAVTNSTASLTQEQKNGLIGHSRTIMAYNLLLEVNRQYQNGIRVNVEDADNLGPFLSYTDALRGIRGILDDGNTLLGNAGADFVFTSTLGNVARVKQLNRALAARVEMYKGARESMRQLLAETWVDPDGDMNLGVYHLFGQGGNNVVNPLFNVPGQTKFVAHPQFVAQAETGDTRFSSKTTKLTEVFASDDLSGDVQATIFGSLESPIGIVRNEELVLMLAEANIGFDNATTVDLINKVRAKAGLGAYTGATDEASLITQLLHERRYSLFGEGHRWIDMRRFGKLADIPRDRAGDIVHEQFPRPLLEE